MPMDTNVGISVMNIQRDSRVNVFVTLLGALVSVTVLLASGAPVSSASPLKPDPNFSGGIVMPHIAGTGLNQYWGDAIAEPDGRYVVAFAYQEHASNPATGDETIDVALVRLNNDGSIDLSFGTRGVARANIVGRNSRTVANAFALKRDSLGRYVVVGMTEGPVSPRSDTYSRIPFVMRINHNGRRDRSFGDQGLARLRVRDYFVYAQASEVSIIGRETILVSGLVGYGRGDHFVARLRPNGALDRRFGDGGVTRIGASNRSHDEPGDMVVQNTGRIVLCGTSFVRRADRWFSSFVGLTPQGRLDVTFGNRGRQFADVGQRKKLNGTTHCALTPEQQIIASATSDQSQSRIVLLKLDVDGAIDSNFAAGRTVNTEIEIESTQTNVALMKDSSVIVAGYNPIFQNGCLLFRFILDGTADAHFGEPTSEHPNVATCLDSTASQSSPMARMTREVHKVIVDPNGSVLALVRIGAHKELTNSSTIALIRVHSIHQ